MRVAIFIQSLAQGGAERVAIQLARAFGVHQKSYLLTRSSAKSDFFPDEAGVTRVGLSGDGAASPSSTDGKMLKASGTLPALLERGIRRFGTLRLFWGLRLSLRKCSADILITMLPVPNILGILAARSLGIPVIACERNYPPARKLPLHWELARRLTYRFATAHVAQTERIADWLRDQTHVRRVTVIPNPISLPLVAHEPVVQPDEMIAPDRRVILLVGSKCWQKGFDRVPDILSIVAAEHAEWDVVIVGMTAIFPEDVVAEAVLYRSRAELGLESRIHVIPKVGNIADWYARADIFALTSRFEGYPNVLLEAMAHGLACVSFDCPTGPADMIIDGSNGRIVPDGDTVAFAQALGAVMQAPELREALGKSAEAVRVTNSEATIMAQWQQLIDTTLATTRKEAV